jgi:hypothetical protein
VFEGLRARLVGIAVDRWAAGELFRYEITNLQVRTADGILVA